MDIDSVYQPISERLGDILIEKLTIRDDPFDRLYLIVAFVKKSGVSRIQDAFNKFKEGGGEIKAVVGIDSQGTTKEGLELLYTLCNELYVFHDENIGQSFHPKIYILEREEERAEIYIGSSNLTKGGLFSNYETNIKLDLDLTNSNDNEIFQHFLSVFSYYSNTDDEYDRCKAITNELIQSLESGGYLGNEQIQERRRLLEGERRTEGQSGLEQFIRIFGSKHFEEPPPPYREEVEAPIEEIEITNIGFWKRLSNNDVSLTSSPGQIIIPIRYLSYFPNMDNWIDTSSGGKQADIFFDVIFVDRDGNERLIKDVRTIFYVPAPHHPRPNQELRFTFRNRDILESLRVGDILEFRRVKDENLWFKITLLDENNKRYSRYDSTGRKSDVIL